MEEIIYEFYIENRARSTNFYNSKSFWNKDKDRNKMEIYVKKAIEEFNLKPIPEGYVIHFTWIPVIKTGKRERSFDMVNYSSSIKMIEDLLKRQGIIIDDDERYVVSHHTTKTIRNTEKETGFAVILKAVKKTSDEVEKEYLKLLKRL